MFLCISSLLICTLLYDSRGDLSVVLLKQLAQEPTVQSDFHVDQAKLNTILSTSLLGGHKVQNFIAPIRAKDGRTEYFQINSSMRQENGQCVTTRCFSACVTDRMLREQAVLQALEEQKEAARVRQETARKTEFLRKLCHELCNPLAGVSGNLELLLGELQQAASVYQKEEEEQTTKARLSACQNALPRLWTLPNRPNSRRSIKCSLLTIPCRYPDSRVKVLSSLPNRWM